jgi:hypothetical protein
MYMSLRPRKSSGDSIDSRSWSFDSTEHAAVVKKDKKCTKAVAIKRRKREQTVETITPSPIPDKSKYFAAMVHVNNYTGS